ncbi:sigma-70 family RNA polymerase sigma factor [Leptolyngbya sp. AN03gr2]|uniref:sigma-70 family RNA polymerase sigma factor n=1 Tax=unclassified Leptolyngbya TaxID=2650499 RepID=UPI003D320BF3
MPKTSLSISEDDFQSYLTEIGRYPLLTFEEEQSYGALAQHLMSIQTVEEKLTQTLNREPTLAELAEKCGVTEEELKRKIYEGKVATRKFIQCNLRLVVSVAKKYQNRGLSFLDLIQEGSLGVIRAVEKFNPDRGYKFSTYAYWWIRQGITRAIATSSRAVRLPIHVNEKLSKIKKVSQELTRSLNRPPTETEIAEALDWNIETFRELKNIGRSLLSLNQKINSDPDADEIGNFIENDRFPSPEEVAHLSMLRDHISLAFKELDERERKILSLRFGLDDGVPLSLAKIGKELKLSRESVRQIEQKVMRKLRKKRSLKSLIQ